MKNYNLDKNELYSILKEKGITHLYHVNTVSTSATFLKNKHLLSRKFVEENKLFQTEQYSDKKDKEYGVYDDIFLDFIDIHKEWNRYNFYGPFLFIFSIEILKSNLIKELRITINNPVNWSKNESEKDFYYNNLKDFNKNYGKGNKKKDIGSMIILKNIEGKLPLKPYLEKIILDNPNVNVSVNKKNFYLKNLVIEELNKVIEDNYYKDIKRELRHKLNSQGCNCWNQYKALRKHNFNTLKRFFHSKP